MSIDMPGQSAPMTERRRKEEQHVRKEAIDLAIACGLHAFLDALRRQIQSNSLSEARYWGRIKSQIRDRIVEKLDDPQDLASFAEVYDYLDTAVEDRAEARVLARALARVIESIRVNGVEQREGANGLLSSARAISRSPRSSLRNRRQPFNDARSQPSAEG